MPLMHQRNKIMKLQLQKPIYPARDLGYSPTYKNSYSKSGGFSVVGQVFGQNMLDVYSKLGLKGHNGLDIPCAKGTPVFASHDGKVIKISDKPTYGLGVTIQSNDGTFVTIYWHLMSYNVKVGQEIKAFDLIGLADSTGYSTGNHLHFGLYHSEESKTNGYDGAIDPLPYIIENPAFVFNNNLWLGKSGEDVKNWQIFLANEGFLGQVGFAGFTGFFGLQTLEATRRFQIKYGIPATGFVGKLTRAKANELYGR